MIDEITVYDAGRWSIELVVVALVLWESGLWTGMALFLLTAGVEMGAISFRMMKRNIDFMLEVMKKWDKKDGSE